MNTRIFIFSIFYILCLTTGGFAQSKIPITSNSEKAIKLYKEGFQSENKLEKDEAEISYKKAIEIDPNFALVYIRLAMLRDNYDVRRKYIAKAMKFLDKVSEGERLWILGRNAFYGTGKDEDEYGYFEKLVKLYPLDEKANYFFGFVNIHHGKRNVEKTIQHYKKAIELNPNFIIAHNDLGYAYLEKKDFNNAEKAFQGFIKLLPDKPDAYDSYADLLMRMGQFEKSVQMYDKVLSIDPKYPWAIMGKATNLDFLERNTEARSVLLALDNIKLTDYEDRHKWRSKFGSFVHEGDIKSAIKVLKDQNRQAKDRNDFHQQFFSYLRMIRLLFEMGDVKQGLKEYDNWVRFVKPASKSAQNRVAKLGHYYKSYVAYLEDKNSLAYKLLKEYETTVGSINDRAKQLKTLLLIKEKNYKKALEIIETTNLNNAYNQFRIGEIYKLIGDNNKAQEWFEKAANHNVRNVLDFALVRKKAKENLTIANVSVKNSPSINFTKANYAKNPINGKTPVKIPRVFESPMIDGNLNEEIWKSATLLKDFVQTSPGDNTAPSKPTEVLLAYDEKHLYIAFKCFDDRDKIRASFVKRDDAFSEDNVRIFLDTFDDKRRAYLLGFNPLGIQQDGIYTEGAGADFSVDIVMESKGVIHDWGWVVEVKIPFKSLRYSSGKNKTWGFNVIRNIKRFNNEVDSWVPFSREIAGQLNQHGKITGLDEIKRERTLEIIPSITFFESGNRVDGNLFVNQPIKFEGGLTLKYTITPNITLDAAINPDFAEIEADAPVVTANQRFPIFFTEKRPFFLEGADIFQSPLRLFNSRAIFDPDAAIKLTGKVGKNTFGFLGSVDNKRAIDTKSYAGVFRLKRDFGKENNIGLFTTTNHYPERHNSLVGVDGRVKFDKKTTLTFQIADSYTRGFFFNPVLNTTNYESKTGLAYYLQYDYNGRHRRFLFRTEGRSREYRSDIGFSRRRNTNASFFRATFSTEPKPKSPLISLHWGHQTGFRFDWQKRSQAAYYNTNIGLHFQRNTSLHATTFIAFDRLVEDEFGAKRTTQNPNQGAFFGDPERSATGGSTQINFRTNPVEFFTFRGFFEYYWKSFDFDFGSGRRFPRVSAAALNDEDAKLDPGTGTEIKTGFSLSIKPTNSLNMSLNYRKSKLVRDDTKLTAFNVNIFSWRTQYQFSRFIFARSRWDYNTLSSRIKGQMLLGWNPNPGTAFYVGYNDTIRYRGYNKFVRRFRPGFERDSRTFFIRMSYLFRKSF